MATTSLRAHGDPWPLDDLVRAQCMACAGAGLDAIAAALGRTADDVRRRLDGDEPRAPRPAFAAVGYPQLKTRP